MMMTATQRRARRNMQDQQPGQVFSIPAPVNGWNARDPLAGMKEGDAVTLDNWVPRAGYVEARRGFIGHVTDASLNVESLMVYRGGAEDADELFCVSAGSLYDVTASGSLASALVTSLTSHRWNSVNFANDGGAWLLAFSGSDTPLIYDGTSWTTNSITGSSGSLTLTSSTLIDACVHKRRIMMVERESLRIWYLATNAKSGSTGLLDLGPVFDKGGVITCIGTWTIDGGQGADDMLVIVSNQGQIAIYQGIDPSDANNWSLVGVYEVGKPLGRRALFKYGAELILLTSDGAVPLSQALKLDRAQQKNIAITNRIQNAFAMAAHSYSGNFGWEALLYPAGQLAIVNVPVTSQGLSYQYVQNVQTGAWCRFTGINAYCWAYANGQAYFGTAGGVYHWDTGSSDNGTAITYDVLGAFLGYSTPHRLKQFTMMRPILRAPSTVRPAIDVMVEYNTGAPFSTPDAVTAADDAWGVGQWGVALWAASLALRLDWVSVTGLGLVGAPRMRLVSNPSIVGSVYPEIKMQIVGFDLLYTPGGVF